MSKRKGNIKYPRHLLETECIWNHIRFFFIYGHYREKLNFAFKKYNEVCKLLKSFRQKVKKLEIAESSNIKSSDEAKFLINKLTTDFEKHMNNDLHVKAAFDSLYETVSSLVALTEKKMLNQTDSKYAIEKIKAIDTVLQAFF